MWAIEVKKVKKEEFALSDFDKSAYWIFPYIFKRELTPTAYCRIYKDGVQLKKCLGHEIHSDNDESAIIKLIYHAIQQIKEQDKEIFVFSHIAVAFGNKKNFQTEQCVKLIKLCSERNFKITNVIITGGNPIIQRIAMFGRYINKSKELDIKQF